MILAGHNLYRVNYKMAVSKVKEIEFTRLVVAYSEKEAAAHIGNGVTLVQPVESDISLYIPNQYLKEHNLNDSYSKT